MRLSFLMTGLLALGGCSANDSQAAGGRILSINGSTTVHSVVERAAQILREESSMKVTVDVQGGSGGGIAQVAEGRVDIGTSSRPLTAADRERWPEADLQAVVVGYDAVALAVSHAVYEGGVRSVTKDEARAIFEGRIENWSELGGPDAPIFVYDKEPGRGTREVFEAWAYGADVIPPLVSFERYAQVGGNEEGAAKTEAHESAITLLSASWVERRVGLQSLSLVGAGGELRTPTLKAIEDGSYPLVRPLIVLTSGAPDPAEEKFLELLASKRGAKLVEECGYLCVSAMAADQFSVK